MTAPLIYIPVTVDLPVYIANSTFASGTSATGTFASFDYEFASTAINKCLIVGAGFRSTSTGVVNIVPDYVAYGNSTMTLIARAINFWPIHRAADLYYLPSPSTTSTSINFFFGGNEGGRKIAVSAVYYRSVRQAGTIGAESSAIAVGVSSVSTNISVLYRNSMLITFLASASSFGPVTPSTLMTERIDFSSATPGVTAYLSEQPSIATGAQSISLTGTTTGNIAYLVAEFRGA